MRLWTILRSESRTSLIRLVFMAVASGLSSSILLAIINIAAGYTISATRSKQTLYLGFVASLLLYVVSQRYILRVSNAEIESMVGRMRARLSDKIRRADLQPIEAIGRQRIYDTINRDTQTISQAASPTIIAIQSAVMVLFIGLYIALLNPQAFLMTLLVVAIGMAIHNHKRRELMANIQESRQREGEFFSTLNDLIEGFKEVKLNAKRSKDVYVELLRLTNTAAAMKTNTAYVFADHFVFSQTTFYVLLALIVFVLPQNFAGQLMPITAAILFVIGPLSSLIGTLPVFSMADLAVANLAALEEQLDLLEPEVAEAQAEPPPDFRDIRLSRVYFAYRDRERKLTFEVGPVDLTIEKGTITFIVGGNGSGKSTFLKLLAGLYYPESGSIEIDDKDVTATGYSGYRNLFSAIFSDYHLFQRLFGISPDDATVNRMLNEMELSNKTQYRHGRFENQDLSTGQRKRLALIVALLEERPVYVFDEWAADQDPHFRERFYKELLPGLKHLGKTVIAATHDDRYFSVASRVIRMENGKIVEAKEIIR